MTKDEVTALVAGLESSIVAERGATGVVGPTAPLAFYLDRWMKPGSLVPLEGEVSWRVGLDAEAKVVREGPVTYFLYTQERTTTLTIRDNGRVGGCRVFLHPDGKHVQGAVSLATGESELNSYRYDYANGLVSDMYWYSSARPLSHYVARRGHGGALDSIEVEGGGVVYRRAKTSLTKRLTSAKFAVERLVDEAIRTQGSEGNPLFAVVLEYSGSATGALFPPNVWCVDQALRNDVQNGRRLAEVLWNPLIDQLRFVETIPAPHLLDLGAELQTDGVSEVVHAYRKWSRLWTGQFAALPNTAEDFLVVAIDPEVDSPAEVVEAAVGRRRFLGMSKAGLV